MDTPPSGATGPWLTRREAAERLRVSIDTVDRAIADGRLTPYRIGTAGTKRYTVRLRQDDVDALPEAGT